METVNACRKKNSVTADKIAAMVAMSLKLVPVENT